MKNFGHPPALSQQNVCMPFLSSYTDPSKRFYPMIPLDSHGNNFVRLRRRDATTPPPMTAAKRRPYEKISFMTSIVREASLCASC